MRLLSWFRQQRQWHRDHIAAFAAVVQQEADGLTLFQHQALEAVAPFVDRALFKRVAMKNEPGEYLVAPLGAAGAELYIYPNDAGVFGTKPHAWFEEWAYLTPSDLLESLVKECASRVA